MAKIKCKYSLKMSEITCKMTKYLLTCKMQQKTAYYTSLYTTLHKKNDFIIAKIKATLFLENSINKEKTVYINIFDKKDLASIDEKMLDKSKIVKNAKS